MEFLEQKTPVGYAMLRRAFGTSHEANKAIFRYVETGEKDPRAPKDWDWEDLVDMFYVPTLHLVDTNLRLIEALNGKK